MGQMSPLTPEQVRVAYLASVPRMHSRFKKAVGEFREVIFHKTNYMQLYPQEMLRLAEEELRQRMDEACEKVEALLESRWSPPTSSSTRGAFIGCFMHDGMHHDPFSDLYARVDAAYSDIGQPDPKDRPTLRYKLSQIQAYASEEAIARLETYVVKNRPGMAVHNYGTVTSQQIGDHNTASISQSVQIDSRSIRTAIRSIEQQLNDFPEAEREEVRVHIDEVSSELASSSPQPSRLKASLNAIGRMAKDASLDGLRSIVEGAVSGLVKSMGGR
jgi:phage-related protein